MSSNILARNKSFIYIVNINFSTAQKENALKTKIL